MDPSMETCRLRASVLTHSVVWPSCSECGPNPPVEQSSGSWNALWSPKAIVRRFQGDCGASSWRNASLGEEGLPATTLKAERRYLSQAIPPAGVGGSLQQRTPLLVFNVHSAFNLQDNRLFLKAICHWAFHTSQTSLGLPEGRRVTPEARWARGFGPAPACLSRLTSPCPLNSFGNCLSAHILSCCSGS